MTKPPAKTRLGAISFINTLPVYFEFSSELLDESGIELVYDTPANLNQAMASGRLDISPVSSAFYLRHREQFILLDDLSVSSGTSVNSVLFLSKAPLGKALLDQPVIPVPDDSETSIALLADILLKRTGLDLRPWFMTYPAPQYPRVLEKLGCALIIGDHALLAHESGLTKGFHCYDLAQLWFEETGLPFVFAVWVADRAWAEAHPMELARLNQQLCQGRDRFFAEPKRIEAGVTLAGKRCKIAKDTIRRYFAQSLDYRLEAPHREALSRFDQILDILDSLIPESLFPASSTPSASSGAHPPYDRPPQGTRPEISR